MRQKRRQEKGWPVTFSPWEDSRNINSGGQRVPLTSAAATQRWGSLLCGNWEQFNDMTALRPASFRKNPQSCWTAAHNHIHITLSRIGFKPIFSTNPSRRDDWNISLGELLPRTSLGHDQRPWPSGTPRLQPSLKAVQGFMDHVTGRDLSCSFFVYIFLFVPCGRLTSAFYCTLNTHYRIVSPSSLASAPWTTKTCNFYFTITLVYICQSYI